MFRVLVERNGVHGLFAGFKPGEAPNTYLVSVADYDVPPDAYEEYPKIESASEKAQQCRNKNWTATVIDELGNVAA